MAHIFLGIVPAELRCIACCRLCFCLYHLDFIVDMALARSYFEFTNLRPFFRLRGPLHACVIHVVVLAQLCEECQQLLSAVATMCTSAIVSRLGSGRQLFPTTQ